MILCSMGKAHFSPAFAVRCFAALIFSVFLVSCSERTQQQIEQIISSSPTAQKADLVCSTLPVPQEFTFVRKNVFGNTEYTVVTFRYASKLSARRVAEYFKYQLPTDGWEFTYEEPETPRKRLYLRFLKDGMFVSIERLGNDDVNFNINCGIFR